VQCVWCHARSGRQCGPQHVVRGEIAPVRARERVIVFSCAAEPGIPSMRGKDQRAENGGVSTGPFNIMLSAGQHAEIRIW